MSETTPYTHVTESERNLPTHKLLKLLREAMTAPGPSGRSLQKEAEAIEKQREWMKGAEGREAQALEHFANQYFAFLGVLLEKKPFREYAYTDLKTRKDESIRILQEFGGIRAVFTFDGDEIDLLFHRGRNNIIQIKKQLKEEGGKAVSLKLPPEAAEYPNQNDFSGPNLKYLRKELSALSGVLDSVDDFRADIS